MNILIACILLLNSGFISLIDDDTLTPNSVEAFHKVCTDNSIVGTFACITSRGQYYPTLFDTLRTYEEEGFQVVLHCHEQKNFYRWNENLDMSVSGVKSVAAGANYLYIVNGRVCPLSVEEVHLDSSGNGHIFFNYMQQYYPSPTSTSGILQKSSGSGDDQITYSDYQIRPFRNDSLVCTDMETAISLLQQNGFKDYHYFVSPYGAQDIGLQNIVQAHSLNCLVSISNNDYLSINNNQYTPFNIPRAGFNATDAGASTLDNLKALMDSTASNNGWLLIGTHIYNGWTDSLKRTRFKEMVDYAKSKGLPFVTLKEGFERYNQLSSSWNQTPTSVMHMVYPTSCKKYYTLMGVPCTPTQSGIFLQFNTDGTVTKIFKQ